MKRMQCSADQRNADPRLPTKKKKLIKSCFLNQSCFRSLSRFCLFFVLHLLSLFLLILLLFTLLLFTLLLLTLLLLTLSLLTLSLLTHLLLFLLFSCFSSFLFSFSFCFSFLFLFLFFSSHFFSFPPLRLTIIHSSSIVIPLLFKSTNK